eukprot:snap_masked-scaffold149_size310270-processed-gene-2.12 protein:Tk01273 transcript:snap_masked-scaffold149_size310270-processed-gene-2.12-mRNA-1 annotation:"hypothetical protein CAPTEDRAFT_165965"
MILPWMSILVEAPVLAVRLILDFTISSMASIGSVLKSAITDSTDWLRIQGNGVSDFTISATSTSFSGMSLIVEAPVLAIRSVLDSIGNFELVEAASNGFIWMWSIPKGIWISCVDIGSAGCELAFNTVMLVWTQSLSIPSVLFQGTSTSFEFLTNGLVTALSWPWFALEGLYNVLPHPNLWFDGWALRFHAISDATWNTISLYPLALGEWIGSGVSFAWTKLNETGSFMGEMGGQSLQVLWNFPRWALGHWRFDLAWVQGLPTQTVDWFYSTSDKLTDLSQPLIQILGNGVEQGVNVASYPWKMTQEFSASWPSLGMFLWWPWSWLQGLLENEVTEKPLDIVDIRLKQISELNVLEAKVVEALKQADLIWNGKSLKNVELPSSLADLEMANALFLDETTIEIATPSEIPLTIKEINFELHGGKPPIVDKEDPLNQISPLLNDMNIRLHGLQARIPACCHNLDLPSLVAEIANSKLDPLLAALKEDWTGGTITKDHAMGVLDQALSSLPSDLRARWKENLVTELKSQVLAELAPAIQMHLQTNRGPLQETEVQGLIFAAIAKYDADKTGMFDYALENAGASVVSIRCTETFTSRARRLNFLGLPIWTFNWGPRVAIQGGLIPGECWAFKGAQGYLVIELSRPMKPSMFSLEHVPKTMTPTDKLDSAPKDFQVLALKELHDPEPIHLGNFTYVLKGEESNQFFDATRIIEDTVKLIELRILSNHGNVNYTCLYRFRVHGVEN